MIRAAVWAAVVAAGAAPPGDFEPARASARLEPYAFHYRSQLVGPLDRPVGEGITLAGVTYPARLDERGKLEIDIQGQGRFRKISSRQALSFRVKGEGEKAKTHTIKLEVRPEEGGAWVYRNITPLRLRIGAEQFVVVDADGDGVYNEAGVDGMAWWGRTWLFPLPGPNERWCSETSEFTGLALGPRGETTEARVRPLATTLEGTLPILKGINEERVKLGLTPRPEDPALSADLQKHCRYMAKNNTLTHPERPGKPGYTPEGHKAGMRSILSSGSPADRIARGMVNTYFHRQDVIRPATTGFGVGYEGRYGGIDGRTALEKVPSGWTVVCPVPDQEDVGLRYGKEAPDATPGDPAAGWPITAYFDTRSLKLTAHSLRALAPAGTRIPPGVKVPGEAVDCYVYDPKTGASASMTGFQKAVCIIPKDPLKPNTLYEVTLKVDVSGSPWERTWRFSTGAGGR